MLNFGGLGFEFEATDDGAEKVASGISASIDGLWNQLKQTAPMVGKAGRAMSAGFGKMRSIGSKALGGLALATASAIEQATDPKLSSSIDQMMAGFGKSFKAMTVGMNITSKEAKKMQGVIGSAAYSLNEDMDGAAKSWAAFRKQSIDLNKVLGSKGTAGAMKDLIKVTSVYEVEGEQLANVIAGHIKGFGFTEERVGSLADKMVFLGKQYNIGREAIQAWPAIFETLNQELADFGRNAKPEDIEQYTTSIIGLGAGLHEALGVSGQEGIEMARNALTVLLGERKNIINMFRGTGGEVGAFTERMIESGAGIEGAMKMLQTEPMAVMDMLSKMGQNMQQQTGTMSTSFQRFSQGVNEALGPGITFAMKGGWDKVRDKMANVSEYLKSPEAKGAFTDFAQHAHSTGLTMQDRWERMLDGMRHKLMSITKKEKGQWFENMSAGFKKTTDAIKQLAEDKGPAGALIKKLLMMRDVGLSALIPELGKLAPLFGGALSALVPFMTAFGAMGLSFAKVGKMGLAGGALFVLFKMLKDGPEEAIEQFKTMGKTLLTVADTIFPGVKKKVLGFFGDIEREGFGAALGRWAKQLGAGISELLSKVDWGGLVKNVVVLMGKAVKGIGSVLVSLFAGVSGGESEVVLGNILVNVITGAWDIAKGAVQGLWASLFDADSVSGAVSNFAQLAIGGLGVLLAFSKKFRTAFMTNVVGGVRSGMVGVSKVMKTQSRLHNMMARKAGMGIVKSYRVQFHHLGRVAKRGMRNLGKRLKSGAKLLGGAGLFFGLMEGMEQVKIRGKEIANIFEDEMVPASQKAALAGEQAFMGVASTVDAVLMGLPSTLGQALGISENELSAFYHWMVASFETSIFTVVEFFSRGWSWIKLAAEGAIGGILDFFKSTKLDIQELFFDLVKKVTEAFYPLGRKLFYPFAWLGFKLKGWMAEFVEGLLSKAPSWVKKLMGEEKIKGLEDWVRGTKTEQKEFLKGRTFEEVYDEQTAKALRGAMSVFDGVTKGIEKEREDMTSQAAAWAKEMEQANKSMGDLGKDITDYHKEAERQSLETVAMSRRRRAEKERKGEKAVVEEGGKADKKGKGGKGKKGEKAGKEAPPTPQERAQSEWWMRGAPPVAAAAGPPIDGNDIKAIRKYLENPKPVPLDVKADRKLKGIVKVAEGTSSSRTVPAL